MQRITVDLPDDLYKRLKVEVLKRFGGKHGDLKRAVIEALELWLKAGRKL